MTNPSNAGSNAPTPNMMADIQLYDTTLRDGLGMEGISLSLADKLLICCTLIALVAMDRVWAWVAMVVVAREFAVTGLRLVAAQAEVISASRSGKIKMVLQVATVIALILNTRYTTLNDVLVILMVVATVVSGVEYFVNGRRHLAASISR